MDARLFRLPTKPNFFAAAATANPFDVHQRQKFSQLPTEDIRFPGWAAPMSDGRLVTNYQNHCSQNIPSGNQFATKEWMTHNATELIQVSRDRNARQTGAIYGLDTSVVPSPASIVECTRSDCTRTATHIGGGIGTERYPNAVPELFGTWETPATGRVSMANVPTTLRYEGGRNTPRGGEMV